MKYVVNTIWKHPNDINWDNMREGLERLRDDEGAAEEVTWYEVDSKTHGSVAVYSSQEKYESYKSKLEEYRNCLLYTSPSPRDWTISRMPSSA